MQIALWNHHTPYLYLLATALPEHTFLAARTDHAPGGWREDQRPRPENVVLWAHESGVRVRSDAVEVVLAQTAADLRTLFMDSDWRYVSQGSVLFLAHNRAEYDWPNGVFRERRPGHVRLIAISDMKAASYRAAGYSLPITVIPPGIRLEDYGPWVGHGGYVLTVANNLRRPLFDVEAWLAATKGLLVRLVGEGNEGLPGAVGPAASWEALKEEYRHAAVYLSVNKWPAEDAWNLALLEAMATGTPCVVLKNETAPYTLKRAEPADLRARLEDSLAFPLGGCQRGDVAEAFPFDRFAQAWRRVFEEVAGG